MSDILRLRGLPYSVNEQQIRQFFEGFDVQEVYISERFGWRPSAGLAYVRMRDATAAREAWQSLNKNLLGGRYIQIFHASPHAILEKKAKDAEARVPQNMVLVSGLNNKMTAASVLLLFNGIPVAGGISAIRLLRKRVSRALTGEALVQMANVQAVQEAVLLDQAFFEGCYVRVRHLSDKQVFRTLQCFESDTSDRTLIGDGGQGDDEDTCGGNNRQQPPKAVERECLRLSEPLSMPNRVVPTHLQSRTDDDRQPELSAAQLQDNAPLHFDVDVNPRQTLRNQSSFPDAPPHTVQRSGGLAPSLRDMLLHRATAPSAVAFDDHYRLLDGAFADVPCTRMYDLQHLSANLDSTVGCQDMGLMSSALDTAIGMPSLLDNAAWNVLPSLLQASRAGPSVHSTSMAQQFPALLQQSSSTVFPPQHIAAETAFDLSSMPYGIPAAPQFQFPSLQPASAALSGPQQASAAVLHQYGLLHMLQHAGAGHGITPMQTGPYWQQPALQQQAGCIPETDPYSFSNMLSYLRNLSQ